MTSSIVKARQIRQYLSPILQQSAFMHTVCDSVIMRNAPISATQHNKMNDSFFSSSLVSIRSFSTAIESSTKNKTKVKIEKNEESKSASKEKPRRLSEVPISDVLKAKHTLRWVEPVICQESTIKEAITVCIDRGLSGMMVVDRDDTTSKNSKERGKVVGMTTSRDLLRVLSMCIKEGQDAEQILTKKIGSFMTPIRQVIYGRPDETVGMCRTIMAKLGVKCLPILHQGRVEGLITSKDMSDFGLDAKDRGGKKNFLNDVSERVGLDVNTIMAEPPKYLKAQLALKENPLFVNVGVAELPHPFKSNEKCGMSHRDYGPNDFATDSKLSEDAHFIREIYSPSENGSTSLEITYMGVADGVGSWREYGVDPRQFATKLMEECDNVINHSISNYIETKKSDPGRSFNQLISPSDILAQAYERVKEQNIIGSSTACVALFDNNTHQLHFSNLGDTGIIVLRHIDSDVAGALKRNRIVPRVERESDLRVAFVSQQQLISFNHPFQLGWTGEELVNGDSSLKSPADFCSTSIHLKRGDIIIMATDGLFDNVDIDNIADIALKWERKHGFMRDNDTQARERRWQRGNSMTLLSAEKIHELAKTLCSTARVLSLDKNTDSPFAILAKENDIMWSGGMPDDCTVVAMQIVGKSRHDKI